MVNKEAKSIAELINRDFGQGSITILGNKVNVSIPVVSTGSLILDQALGVGGLPYGRIVEIFGETSTGKTTICLHTIANVQKQGGLCAILDSEHALDIALAKKLGVDVDNLLISQPNSGEECLNIAETLIQTKKVNCIVIDSVAALTPQAEIDGVMGEQTIGKHAKLMSQALRKVTGIAQKSNTLLIMTNQVRSKVGVYFGSPIVTTGGKALPFYSTIRLEVKRKKVEYGKTKIPVGHHLSIKVVKNKVAVPFRVAETFLEYGIGFDQLNELFDLCLAKKIITARGPNYYLDDIKIGLGKDKSKNYIKDNNLIEKLKNQVLELPKTQKTDKTKYVKSAVKKVPKTIKKKAVKSSSKSTNEPVSKLKILAEEINTLKSKIKSLDASSPERKPIIVIYNTKVKEYKEIKNSMKKSA